MSDASEIVPLDANDLLRALLGHEVDFVVIGAVALAAHGYIRGTKDLDIVPAPAPENLARLFSALQSIGATPLEIAV